MPVIYDHTEDALYLKGIEVGFDKTIRLLHKNGLAISKIADYLEMDISEVLEKVIEEMLVEFDQIKNPVNLKGYEEGYKIGYIQETKRTLPIVIKLLIEKGLSIPEVIKIFEKRIEEVKKILGTKMA